MKDILITSSILIPAVFLLRFLFRRTVSRRVQYARFLMRFKVDKCLPIC